MSADNKIEVDYASYWFTFKLDYVNVPCPYATWTLWCPHVNTEECLRCPVYLDRNKTTKYQTTYAFPRDTDGKVP